MTNEQKVLLRLVGATLKGITIDTQSFQNVNWLLVAKESDIQAVLPMAFDAVYSLKQNIPEEVYEAWSDRAIACLVKNTLVQKSQIHLVELLNKKGYPYTIIKGEASAKYYNRPELRTLGDVDFLVDPAQNEEIKAILCEDGYKSMLEDHECHTVFKKPNAHLEMHREVSGVPHGEVGKKVREFLKDLLTSCQRNADFNTPQKHHHALILLLHTQHHLLGEGMGLRHLCDWAAFVDSTHTEPFWEEKVFPFLEEIGLMTLARVLTKTCAIAFDTACPDWAKVDEKLCYELLDDVLLGGNFGRKGGGRALSGALISNRGKDKIKKGKWNRLYAVFKENVKRRHPVVKKYPILYPFFAIYKAIRFFVLSLLGKKRSIKSISKDIDKRKNIYQQLKIFEVEENE